MIGSKVGDYEVVRLIGRGGMGAVYEAFNAALNRRAAIKVLLPEYAEQEEVVRRFFNEARAVNAVSHPGVVRVSDVGRSPDGGLYLVMEYLQGETLAERLRSRGGKLPETDVATISWQLAGVLAAAHARSIVHRDIKPANIMIVPDAAGPGGERVKLLDFGIAKLSAERGGEEMTRKGQLMGTATYMSPEQFQGEQPVDGQSDVYSLGVVMYLMVSGNAPFKSTNGELALAAMHMFNTPRPMREVAPEAASWLTDLVDSMLRKIPTERPMMAAVTSALQEHLPFRASGRSGIRPAIASRSGSTESSSHSALSASQLAPALPSTASVPPDPQKAAKEPESGTSISQPGTLTSVGGAEISRNPRTSRQKQWLLIGASLSLCVLGIGGALVHGRRGGHGRAAASVAAMPQAPAQVPIESPPAPPQAQSAPAAMDMAKPALQPEFHPEPRGADVKPADSLTIPEESRAQRKRSHRTRSSSKSKEPQDLSDGSAQSASPQKSL